MRAKPCSLTAGGGFYCTKPEDECHDSEQCVVEGTFCDHDAERGIFACVDRFCPSTID